MSHRKGRAVLAIVFFTISAGIFWALNAYYLETHLEKWHSGLAIGQNIAAGGIVYVLLLLINHLYPKPSTDTALRTKVAKRIGQECKTLDDEVGRIQDILEKHSESLSNRHLHSIQVKLATLRQSIGTLDGYTNSLTDFSAGEGD